MAPKARDWVLKALEELKEDPDPAKMLSGYLDRVKTDQTGNDFGIFEGNLKVDGKATKTQNAHCKFHKDCKVKFQAKLASIEEKAKLGHGPESKFVVLQQFDEHGTEIIPKRARMHYAKKYAHLTIEAAKAQLVGVLAEHMPKPNELRSQRAAYLKSQTEKRNFSSTFTSSMQEFCLKDHEFMEIYPGFQVGEDRVSVPFHNPALTKKAIKHIIENHEAHIIMDGTYKNNEEGLLLISAGICVLVETPTGGRNRFLPIATILARSEDEDACSVLLKYIIQLGQEYGNGTDITPYLKDLYIDGSGGGEAAFHAILAPHGCRLHRCLRHIKKNVKESRTGCNAHVKKMVIDAIEFSAKLPTKMQFDALWESLLHRLADPNDLNEKNMADYLSETVLKKKDGQFRCTWQSGINSVQAGFRTYIQNTEERYWRTPKSAFPKKYIAQTASECMLKACRQFQAWSRDEKFAEFYSRFPAPLQGLLRPPTKTLSVRLDAEETRGHQHYYLSVYAIKLWYDAHPNQTFLKHNIVMDLEVNHQLVQTKQLFIMPKYKMQFAIDKHDAMERLKTVLLAPSTTELNLAISGKTINSIRKQRFLFQSFTGIFILNNDTTVDIHCDWVHLGQTSQSIFVDKYLANDLKLVPRNKQKKQQRFEKPSKIPDAMRNACVRLLQIVLHFQWSSLSMMNLLSRSMYQTMSSRKCVQVPQR